MHRFQSASAFRSAGVPPQGAWLWRLKTPAAESYPRRHTEIIAELGVLPMLPILQTMFEKEIRAIVAGSDHFIRRLLHEPDIVGVLPDNGGAGWFG